MGKIRVNYAVVGNDAPLYGTTTPFGQSFVQDGWTTGIPFPYNGTVGYSKSAILGSSTLKPEKITSKEIGFVFSLFENLINLDFTYYNSISSDQIVPVHIAGSSGYQYQLTNIGQISNKGIEILLNITPIKSLDFRWDFSLNFAKNTNNVDILAPGITNLYINGFTGSSIRAVAGKPYGQIFGPGYQRDSKGNVVIDDRQTLSDGSPNSEYGKPFLDPVEKDWGSYQPDWTMGIRNSFTWKGITLSFLFDIKQGGKMLNGTKGVLNYFGRSSESLNRGSQVVFQGIKGHLDALGNVVTSGTNDIKTILDEDWYTGTYGGFSNNTEAYVEDASWVRLREVSLSYMLPKSIVSYTPLSEISVTFTGRNLWLKTPYSGVDPETSLFGSSNAQGYDYFNMPGTKTYTFTLNVKF